MNKLNFTVAKRNAARICELDDAFGQLAINDHGQTIRQVANLSIPCAYLIKAEIVLAVADTADGVNEYAVAEVEELCRRAIARTSSTVNADWKREGEKHRLY